MGMVACIVNSRLVNPGQHVVVEANPAMLPLIQRNRTLNCGRFAVIHGAIAYNATRVSLKSGPDLLGSQIETGLAGDVPVLQLLDVLERTRFPVCTLICDIEGAEIELVNHEIATLRERVATIVLEEHPEYCAESVRAGMMKLLNEAGFESIDALRKVQVFRNSRLHVPTQPVGPIG